jgi:hypothetical protein
LHVVTAQEVVRWRQEVARWRDADAA